MVLWKSLDATRLAVVLRGLFAPRPPLPPAEAQRLGKLRVVGE
jgi:hypothetical protein